METNVRLAPAFRPAAKGRTTTVMTVGEALSTYAGQHVTINLPTGEERYRQLKKTLAKKLNHPLSDLCRTDIHQIVNITATTTPIAANRVRATLSAFIGWCWGRGFVEENFGLATSSASPERLRERVLDQAELKVIWQATLQIGDLWGPFLQTLAGLICQHTIRRELCNFRF